MKLKPLLLGLFILSAASAPAQTVTNIPFLRTLLDEVNFLPTDLTNYYQVEGVVTTHTNLTGGNNILFYFQSTNALTNAGMAVFMTNGISLLPKAGDYVRVTGRLTHFNGLLQFGMHFTNASNSILVLTSNNPLPTPTPFNYAWETDPTIVEKEEGKRIIVSNVIINATGVFAGNVNYGFTDVNTGQTNTVRIGNTITEIIGQAIPTGPINIIAVLGQFDNSNPRTSGYQILPTRLADLQGLVPVPVVRFTNIIDQLVRPGDLPTNTFTEHALRPGERLRMTVNVFDLSNRVVTITPVTNGLPTNAFWTLGVTNGTNLTAQFTYQPTTNQNGSNLVVALVTSTTLATNTTEWNLYTPTAAEQRLHITEFLANPSGTNTSPSYDPLLRPGLSDSNRFQADEFIEIANLNATNFPLGNWTIQDAISNRHFFFPGVPALEIPEEQIPASNSIVVYGGPFNLPPGAPITNSSAASEGSLALNNDGDSIRLRNANGNLVIRIVYTGGDLDTGRNSSLSRYPTLDDAFVQQSWTANTNSSAALQYYGASFSQPVKLPLPVTQPLLSLNTNGGLVINWTADTNVTQTIWRSETMTNRFGVVTGFKPTNTIAFFTDNSVTNTNRVQRFYQIVTPPVP